MTFTLYYRPMACSLASRIALYEAGADARFVRVDKDMRTTEEGADYLLINPMAQVPAVRRGDGEVMTENAVVLQFIADTFPEAGLAPSFGTAERYRMMMWLNFITTELHTGVFHPILSPSAPEGAKAFSYGMAPLRLARLEFHLTGREWLIDAYSVADIYLYVILNWLQVTTIKLSDYPALTRFMARMRERPAVARAFAEEVAMYRAELSAVAA